MKVMDFEFAMGFFSLPMAELTGTRGKVLCVDIQKGMLSELEKKPKRKI
jgi:ubiquinone/menaquinone biosynthesis C-methylase UbiE